MTIYESEVSGLGHKFELKMDRDERLMVIIPHNEKREVYLRPDENQDSQKLFSLTENRARQLGSILGGAYFQPVEMDQVQVPLGEAIIEWFDIDPSSALVRQSLGAANIRKQTGISIIAIQRGGDTLANPISDTLIEADDILVTLGTRDEQQASSNFANTESTDPLQA